MIAPHCVDCDFDHGIDLFFGGLYNFTAFVVAAVRTSTMGLSDFVTVGTFRKPRQGQRIMSAPFVLTRF
jgi:hypothetical protein